MRDWYDDGHEAAIDDGHLYAENVLLDEAFSHLYPDGGYQDHDEQARYHPEDDERELKDRAFGASSNHKSWPTGTAVERQERYARLLVERGSHTILDATPEQRDRHVQLAADLTEYVPHGLRVDSRLGPTGTLVLTLVKSTLPD